MPVAMLVRSNMLNGYMLGSSEGGGSITPLAEAVDYLDRFGEPRHGSGPVFIAHSTIAMRVDGILARQLYSDPKCTRYAGTLGANTKLYPGHVEIDTSTLTVNTVTCGWIIGHEVHIGRISGYYYNQKYTVTHQVYRDGVSYAGQVQGWKNATPEDILKVEVYRTTNKFTVYYMPLSALVLKRDDNKELSRAISDWRGTLQSYLEFGLLGGADAVGFSEAYFNAIDNLPQLSTNNIGNLAQVMDTVRLLLDIRNGDVANIPKDMKGIVNLSKEAWLGYKYAYKTSKQDILELASYARRIQNIADHAIPRVKVEGHYSEGTWSYGCTFWVESKALIPSSVSELLSDKSMLGRAGLAADVENVWDLIPYSFIVDWFVPIGDWLHKICNRSEALGLSISDMWYTKRGEVDIHGSWTRCYQRFRGHGVNYSIPAFREHRVSGTTWASRVGDALALAT